MQGFANEGSHLSRQSFHIRGIAADLDRRLLASVIAGKEVDLRALGGLDVALLMTTAQRFDEDAA